MIVRSFLNLMRWVSAVGFVATVVIGIHSIYKWVDIAVLPYLLVCYDSGSVEIMIGKYPWDTLETPHMRVEQFEKARPGLVFWNKWDLFRDRMPRLQVTFPLWLPASLFLTCFVALSMWLRRRRRGDCCNKCGYSLIGNTSGVCPECGTRVDCRKERVRGQA
jgi:hypothetical protein